MKSEPAMRSAFILSDLDRPLGKKQPGSEPSPKQFPYGPLATGSLLVAVIALGAALWVTVAYLGNADRQIVKAEIEDLSGKIVTANEADGEAETPMAVPNTSGSQNRGTYDDTGNGMQALAPDGSIAVPKPRPPKTVPQQIGEAHLPDPDLIEKGATGGIPKRSADGRRPMDVYAREPDTTGNFGVARVVLIVGGMGISQTNSQMAIQKLPPAVTLAFAPYGNSLLRWMQAARKSGHELLLQVPMEPFGYPQNTAGPHTLTVEADSFENIANLHWAMSRITNYVGILNYQGARFLSEPAALKPVFDEIAKRGLLFIDDGSASASKSADAAAKSVLPYAKAQIQLDSLRNRQAIAEKFEALVEEAKRTGVAIGVANAFEISIDMMAQFASQANDLGIELTPVSAIVTDPERDR